MFPRSTSCLLNVAQRWVVVVPFHSCYASNRKQRILCLPIALLLSLTFIAYFRYSKDLLIYLGILACKQLFSKPRQKEQPIHIIWWRRVCVWNGFLLTRPLSALLCKKWWPAREELKYKFGVFALQLDTYISFAVRCCDCTKLIWLIQCKLRMIRIHLFIYFYPPFLKC